ncbi:MAG: stage II sporulation protein P, partial [Lachnospiraceae bacterium]|nr:stage II sporulation protein P [Lachnospiraceae bacterium]
DDILAGMEAENEAATKQIEDMIRNENAMVAKEALDAQKEAVKGFSQALEKQVQYDWSFYTSADSLIKDFYAVDSTTKADADLINLDKLLNRDLTIDKNTEGYQILIYHTHSQEAFADSVPGDKSTTIVGAGERLAQILTEKYGYKVLHHMGEYDVEYRDDAYSKALPEIEKVLAENPEIQVVIDLHRDEVAEGTKLVTDLQGRPTARFMFFNGLSYTRQTGKIGYLENENLEGNLAFSFQMQVACNEYFPGLTRRIYLKGYRYNMHLKERCLLVELGAQNNTVEEIMNACDPLAQALDMVLSGMVY